MTLFFQQDRYRYELPQKCTDVIHHGFEQESFRVGYRLEQLPETVRKSQI